jgi:hypothetical protein
MATVAEKVAAEKRGKDIGLPHQEFRPAAPRRLQKLFCILSVISCITPAPHRRVPGRKNRECYKYHAIRDQCSEVELADQSRCVYVTRRLKATDILSIQVKAQHIAVAGRPPAGTRISSLPSRLTVDAPYRVSGHGAADIPVSSEPSTGTARAVDVSGRKTNRVVDHRRSRRETGKVIACSFRINAFIHPVWKRDG